MSSHGLVLARVWLQISTCVCLSLSLSRFIYLFMFSICSALQVESQCGLETLLSVHCRTIGLELTAIASISHFVIRSGCMCVWAFCSFVCVLLVCIQSLAQVSNVKREQVRVVVIAVQYSNNSIFKIFPLFLFYIDIIRFFLLHRHWRTAFDPKMVNRVLFSCFSSLIECHYERLKNMHDHTFSCWCTISTIIIYQFMSELATFQLTRCSISIRPLG